WRAVAAQHRQQRGLASTVRTHEREHAAVEDIERDVLEDAAPAELYAHAAHLEGDGGGHCRAHSHPPARCRARRSRTKKNGPPMSDVSRPMGRSAPVTSERAKASAKTMSTAPPT